MKTKSIGVSAFCNLRVLVVLALFSGALFVALFARANPHPLIRQRPVELNARVSWPSAAAPVDTVQEAWVARYDTPASNTDQANAIAVDASGNVYVTGMSFGKVNTNDYATIKYNSAGQMQWAARYNGPANNEDEALAIAVDNSGNVYVTGSSLGSDTNYDYATIKYNSAGQQQWVARYNGPGNAGDFARAIAIDNAGNIYVTGESTGTDSFEDYATIKYNATGQEQWVARYNGPDNSSDQAKAIAIDGSGNVYATGWTANGGNSDYGTVKYNSAGQQQWVVFYNGPGIFGDIADAIAVDGSGNVYVTGESLGSGTDFDYATIKYNSVGQQQWVARYVGPTDQDEAQAMAIDQSGNVYVTGWSYDADSNYDYATVKYNSTGQEQWVARYNGPGNFTDYAHGIAIDISGNIYVTGTSISDTGYDYATIKYDPAGQEQWVARYNSGEDEAFAIAVDSSANVYVTGTSSSGDFDYATIKYVQGATPTPTPTPAPVRVTVAAVPTQINEGQTATYKVHASAAVAQDITVPYTMSGTATSGSDYTLNPSGGQVTILAGQNSAQVKLKAKTDALTEGTETAIMTLQPGSGYRLGNPKEATVSILDP